MNIYLPIAEISVNLFALLATGAGVGFLSGMFGVGGGFLITPILIFLGIPAAVAVASEANQIVASSVSGTSAYWRRRAIDFKMGTVLLVGGVVGAYVGVIIFKYLRGIGQVELLVSVGYVVLLSFIGLLMLRESLRAIGARRRGQIIRTRRPSQHSWVLGLPLRMRFRASKLYISVIPPLILGFLVGILSAMLGVGGGFIMVPAMIYFLHMPTNVVIGTSLFQIIFVTASAAILHAVQNQSVDITLAAILMIGGVIGAQLGASVGQRLRGEDLRALLALIVLGVGARLLFDLVVEPDELYSAARVIIE